MSLEKYLDTFVKVLVMIDFLVVHTTEHMNISYRERGS